MSGQDRDGYFVLLAPGGVESVLCFSVCEHGPVTGSRGLSAGGDHSVGDDKSVAQIILRRLHPPGVRLTVTAVSSGPGARELLTKAPSSHPRAVLIQLFKSVTSLQLCPSCSRTYLRRPRGLFEKTAGVRPGTSPSTST